MPFSAWDLFCYAFAVGMGLGIAYLIVSFFYNEL